METYTRRLPKKKSVTRHTLIINYFLPVLISRINSDNFNEFTSSSLQYARKINTGAQTAILMKIYCYNTLYAALSLKACMNNERYKSFFSSYSLFLYICLENTLYNAVLNPLGFIKFISKKKLQEHVIALC